jgi:translation initiation factor 6
LSVTLMGIFGCASVGCYTLTTEKMAIVPPQLSVDKVKRLEETLKVKAVKTTVGSSVLIGALTSANSNGVVLPHFAQDAEIEKIKSAFPEINIALMETKRTAYGNIVLANDNGAIVDPRLSDKDIDNVAETLGVEAVRGEIAGLPYIGSLAAATNKGAIAHPMIKEEEQKLLQSVLKVPVDVGTVNCGIPYVGTGLIGNTEGALVGFITTGPELVIIENALDLVK